MSKKMENPCKENDENDADGERVRNSTETDQANKTT